jgi:D-alanyl-D-alanine carboxypeptidase
MQHHATHTTVTLVALVVACTMGAQVPDTPAGRQYLAWRKAQDSGDSATVQQFITQSMPWGRVAQEIAMGKVNGGFDVKKVEESSDTRLVVLVQERGPAKAFFRVAVEVAAAPPNYIDGISIRPAQPPAELAPPKLTASELEAARASAPYRQFASWLEAFNTGDRARVSQFLETNYPAGNINAQMRLRSQTNGFNVRGIERASPTVVTGFVEARESDDFGQFTIVVDAAEPHRISRLDVQIVPRPPEFAIAQMDDAQLVAALRTQMDKEVAADRFAGTVLLAKLEKGSPKLMFSGAYGLADREKKTANALDTRFRIGSMNKMFTATSILQLVQAGKIKLTDPFGKYVTDYPNKTVASKVTIHHLLTHTGGTGDIFGPDYDAHRLELKSLNDYVNLYGKRDLQFEPGARWSYSNYGMVLLGVVVERVTGQSYYDYVAEHIYKPAGMTRSGSEPEDKAIEGRSMGYMRGRGGGAWTLNTETLPYRGTAAGGGYSTVNDLLRFATALMNNTLLDAEHTALLIKGKADAGGGRMYAYGFEDERKDGVGAVGHSGGAPGMNGDLRIYPSSGYVIAVLSNLDPPAAQRVSSFISARLPR